MSTLDGRTLRLRTAPGGESGLFAAFVDPPVPGKRFASLQSPGAGHDARSTVTVGTNVLGFNLAAGGYLDSWTVGGVEILNRGDSWNRGLQSQAEWADLETGILVRHCLSASGDRYRQPAVMLKPPTARVVVGGGTVIEWSTIPVEFDPDGGLGVPAVSTDHKGSDGVFVAWYNHEVRQSLWLDYKGTTGLHRLQTTWVFPSETSTAWLDAGFHNALCLNTAFDTVYVYPRAGTEVDVTANVDAVDYRRWSYNATNTYQDDQASPTSAALLPSNNGSVIANNSGSGLSVAVASVLDSVDASGLSLKVSDFLDGTHFTVSTNRTGTTGHDGTQAVILGCDSLLSTRWNHADSVRRIPKGEHTMTRFIAVGASLAATKALVDVER